jgi:hypothetical protein
MILDEPTRIRLLGSIEANRLVLLCGAGLSIPSPSALMSAVRVSRACYDKYLPTMELPAAMRDNVADLAGHFYGTGEFQSLFLGALVPWNELVGQPNSGHAAVADFLVCGAAEGALSANFDPLIEQWANGRKIAMRGALNGQEAIAPGNGYKPLVKFHGCLIRDREKTLWTQAQLAEPQIEQRITTCSQWMGLTLPGKDLLVVGFWTDWGYLNDVIANALNVNPFGSVTVIDPKNSADLESAAPTLWARLTGGTANFQHVRASGADALNELRVSFSRVWSKKFFALGRPMLEAEGKHYAAIDAAMNSEEFYSFRQDAEGVPYHRAARRKDPPAEAAAAAFFHLLLNEAKSTRSGAWYEQGGKLIRVVQGAGEAVNTVRERYKEPPAARQPDMVVCAGALDITIPGSLIASGAGASIVRPGAGGGTRWLTLEQARGELKI